MDNDFKKFYETLCRKIEDAKRNIMEENKKRQHKIENINCVRLKNIEDVRIYMSSIIEK